MVKRLPTVNGDDGAWGTILNNFLGKEHYNDGTDTGTYNGGHQTVTLQPGTTAAATAPLKFLPTNGAVSAALMTTPEVGAVELVGNRMYYTQTSGPTRLNILAVNDSGGNTGDMYYRNSTADMVLLPVGTTGQVLTVAGTTPVPTWATPSGGGTGLTQQQVMGITSMRI
jgi:hypothetical protein